jgi:hypothetical protein
VAAALPRLADALDGFEAGAADVVPRRVEDVEGHSPRKGVVSIACWWRTNRTPMNHPADTRKAPELSNGFEY